jgi:hypothetical protein
MNIDTMRDELIDDCLDTCLNDVGYLRSVIQDKYNSFGDIIIEQLYQQTFGDRP